MDDKNANSPPVISNLLEMLTFVYFFRNRYAKISTNIHANTFYKNTNPASD
jgi:hypothetical protein